MNRDKFLSFYRNEPIIYENASKLWDAIYNILATDSNCPTCGQSTKTVDPNVMVGILATIRIESGRDFKPKRENLNYSAEGLLRTFPRYFTPQLAQQYAYKPEAIANRVYANRMQNGDEASGDGWRYSGVNFLQFTGKENWNKYGFTPENCLDIQKGAEATIQYFKDRGIIQDCINRDWRSVRKKVNGGNGIDSSIKGGTTHGLNQFIKTIQAYTN